MKAHILSPLLKGQLQWLSCRHVNTVRQFNTGDYCLCRYVDETEAMYYGGLFNVYMMSGTSGNKALVTDGFSSTGTGYMNECILT